MRWSKLKQTIENKFSEKLKGRLEFFSAIYDDNEPAGRIWVTIDKIEVANFCDYSSGYVYGAYYNETTNITRQAWIHNAIKNEDRVLGNLVEKGEFSRFDAELCFYEYINLSIEDALKHESPIINMLAMADKRLGKRSLVKIELENLHPLVKKVLELRKEVDYIKN